MEKSKKIKEQIIKVLEKHSYGLEGHQEYQNGIYWPAENEELIKDLVKILRRKP